MDMLISAEGVQLLLTFHHLNISINHLNDKEHVKCERKFPLRSNQQHVKCRTTMGVLFSQERLECAGMERCGFSAPPAVFSFEWRLSLTDVLQMHHVTVNKENHSE